jgi:hypothetical protein
VQAGVEQCDDGNASTPTPASAAARRRSAATASCRPASSSATTATSSTTTRADGDLLFVRPNNIWLRADKPAFDDTLLIVKSTSKKAVNLTVNNGVTVAGFMGFANFNFSGGGDFGISESPPDGMTCPNSVTVTGFDHHYVNSRMRNCNCSRQYLYSYSDVGFADNDAGYDAGIPLGSWTATALCDSAEGGLLKFYAAMR